MLLQRRVQSATGIMEPVSPRSCMLMQFVGACVAADDVNNLLVCRLIVWDLCSVSIVRMRTLTASFSVSGQSITFYTITHPLFQTWQIDTRTQRRCGTLPEQPQHSEKGLMSELYLGNIPIYPDESDVLGHGAAGGHGGI